MCVYFFVKPTKNLVQDFNECTLHIVISIIKNVVNVKNDLIKSLNSFFFVVFSFSFPLNPIFPKIALSHKWQKFKCILIIFVHFHCYQTLMRMHFHNKHVYIFVSTTSDVLGSDGYTMTNYVYERETGVVHSPLLCDDTHTTCFNSFTVNIISTSNEKKK